MARAERYSAFTRMDRGPLQTETLRVIERTGDVLRQIMFKTLPFCRNAGSGTKSMSMVGLIYTPKSPSWIHFWFIRFGRKV